MNCVYRKPNWFKSYSAKIMGAQRTLIWNIIQPSLYFEGSQNSRHTPQKQTSDTFYGLKLICLWIKIWGFQLIYLIIKFFDKIKLKKHLTVWVKYLDFNISTLFQFNEFIFTVHMYVPKTKFSNYIFLDLFVGSTRDHNSSARCLDKTTYSSPFASGS